jgi:hypothetical protein
MNQEAAKSLTSAKNGFEFFPYGLANPGDHIHSARTTINSPSPQPEASNFRSKLVLSDRKCASLN